MIKRIIGRWLFPELSDDIERLKIVLIEIEQAKHEIFLQGKEGMEITGPVVFLGDLKDCPITLSPQIKPEIVLSKFGVEAMFRLAGTNQNVNQCYANLKEVKV